MITKTFDQLAIAGSDQERADAQQEAEQISLDIIISDLSSLDDSNGNYRQTENLTKLGNWLRNPGSDALSEDGSARLLLTILLRTKTISWHD